MEVALHCRDRCCSYYARGSVSAGVYQEYFAVLSSFGSFLQGYPLQPSFPVLLHMILGAVALVMLLVFFRLPGGNVSSSSQQPFLIVLPPLLLILPQSFFQDPSTEIQSPQARTPRQDPR